jgi:hypothetical protein
VVPPLPRWLVDDATPEVLAGLLAVYGRIALLSPEGDVFDQMAGRYSLELQALTASLTTPGSDDPTVRTLDSQAGEPQRRGWCGGAGALSDLPANVLANGCGSGAEGGHLHWWT